MTDKNCLIDVHVLISPCGRVLHILVKVGLSRATVAWNVVVVGVCLWLVRLAPDLALPFVSLAPFARCLG